MPLRIEDYAVIGNCETLALIGRDGSIDWLCLPRYDSAACFAALLGEPKHGRWLLAAAHGAANISRRYHGDTLILETVFRTAQGAVSVIDFMARRDGASDLVRLVRGLEGAVPMRMELIVRFDYGGVVPWVSRQEDGRLQLIAGPDRLLLGTDIRTRGEDLRTVADFTIASGEEASFVLTWSSSFRAAPAKLGGEDAPGASGGFLVGLGGDLQEAPSLRRRRPALSPHIEGAGALGDRRHRRRGHHLFARAARRNAQLGQSLLLAS